MLTYNNYEKFERCIRSMFYFVTERRVKEFIILDNGSYQPELKDFLQILDSQIEKFRVIYSETNLGIAKGRKLLFDVAEGDYIMSFDSDIVIVNPPAFLEIFYKTLSIDKMMLVGGGGGDHPYFPSMEREDIDNKESSENPVEIKIVDEVAGWFHGFKSSILTKNGGHIEMDEQFSPFWAEDSDFCVQIKLVGGKCAILGKGLLGHSWSSCSKKETQVTLEPMWEKFLNKWYTKFGKKFKFEVDEEFYKENYPECVAAKRPREYFLKIGIMKGHVYSRGCLESIYKEAKFKDNKNLTYEKKNYKIQDFVKKYMNLESIMEKNMVKVNSNMEKNFDDLIILVVNDVNKGLSIVSQLVKMQKINICICINKEINYYNITNFLEKYNVNYCLYSFKTYDFDLIPFIACYKKLSKLYNFKRVLNLSTYRNQDFFIKNRIKELISGSVLKENALDIDNFNITILGNLINLDRQMKWNKECVFIEDKNYYDSLFSSYPFNKILEKCLYITHSYDNHVTPRCSPHHSLERIFGFMKSKLNNRKSIAIFTVKLNNKEDLIKLQNNIKYFRNTEILIFNSGEMKHISSKDLNYDYYYLVDEDIELYNLWKNVFNIIDLKDYNNIIFTNDSYKLESDIDEFLQISKYKNLCFIREETSYNLDLFSLSVDTIGIFIEKCEKVEKDLMDKIKTEIFKFLNFSCVWICEKNETEEEIILSYKKSGEDNGEDFPMV